ncbi:MAG: NAD(P)-dependent alcohol dehydrogenase [Candidatus Thiodiazotropha sp. (ex Codakia rugifera)]|nr:NAD(P)-dependent alcohol dehydrogenase [Candidatus Thiodiazotropha sp. (ex Codakia rugifera)]
MKAIVFTQYGSPDSLEQKDVPKPVPKDDELLIRVHASSINSWDWEFLNGTPFINRLMFGLLQPKPGKRILGADIAGTVEAVGRQVTRFQPGDEVFGDLWDNWGGFAEYACAHETAMEQKPVNSTFEDAAAVPQAGVLALQGIRKAGHLQPGHRVLINGAGGGVGTFAVQLAKLSGTEVTGVDIPHKLPVVSSIGADHVIDYTQQDFTNSGEQYDLIVDCQSNRSMSDYKRALRPGGTYAMVGGSRIVPLLIQSFLASLTGESRKFCLVAEGPNKGLTELKGLIEVGKIVPVIDRTYPLEEVPDALRRFGEGHHKGKIVITIKN